MTKHFRRIDGTYIGGFGDGAEPPAEAIECTAPPHGSAIWTDGEWVIPASVFRSTAWLARSEFLSACVGAGIIDQATAEEAADGSWPTAFDPFLSGLESAQRIHAKAVWADGKEVRRDSVILSLIAADSGVTEGQLDEMFGYVG